MKAKNVIIKGALVNKSNCYLIKTNIYLTICSLTHKYVWTSNVWKMRKTWKTVLWALITHKMSKARSFMNDLAVWGLWMCFEPQGSQLFLLIFLLIILILLNLLNCCSFVSFPESCFVFGFCHSLPVFLFMFWLILFIYLCYLTHVLSLSSLLLVSRTPLDLLPEFLHSLHFLNHLLYVSRCACFLFLHSCH